MCERPIGWGPRKGQAATGTETGYDRHRRAGEPACPSCLVGHAERVKRYRKENPEAVAETFRRHYQANRERKLRYQRQWRAANPEKVRANEQKNGAAAAARRRARLANALSIPYTPEQLAARMAFWGDRCWISGPLCSGVADTVDHVIPLARGGPHCLSNLRPACRSCNSSKKTKTLDEIVGRAA